MVQPSDSSANVLSPEPLMQMWFSYAPARVLTTSVQLDLFSHMAAGKKTATEIAQAAQATERGTRMLLNCLVAFQLITKQGENYELTPMARTFLVKESPAYFGNVVGDDRLWQSWSNLTEIVRNGPPSTTVEAQKVAEDFFPNLIRGLHVLNYELAKRLAQHLVSQGQTGVTVLDVGCGSGVWSIAIAEADKQARLVMQDFPGVLEHTKDYLRRHDVEERAEYLPGDLKQVDFGENRFDLVMLGNIVHSEGEASTRDLFNRVYRALKPGGRVAIIEMVPNDERTGPPFALIFAINMLVNTREGDTFTLAEFRRWLTEAGFKNVETFDIGSHSPVVIGIK